MTKEEFDQLGKAYGLFTYKDSNELYLKPQYMWVDTSVMTFEEGKVHISVRLDENGDVYRYGDRIIVSEVSTARFFLNEMMKKRKQILENKKLAKIEEDF